MSEALPPPDCAFSGPAMSDVPPASMTEALRNERREISGEIEWIRDRMSGEKRRSNRHQQSRNTGTTRLLARNTWIVSPITLASLRYYFLVPVVGLELQSRFISTSASP